MPKPCIPQEELKRKLGFPKRKITSPGSYFPCDTSKKAGAAPKPNGAVEGKSGLAVRQLQAIKCDIPKTPPL
jgi:hypothetical protein